MKMSVFKEKFACVCSCQQRFSIFKLHNLISSYGALVESFQQHTVLYCLTLNLVSAGLVEHAH